MVPHAPLLLRQRAPGVAAFAALLTILPLSGCGIGSGYAGPGSNTDTGWWDPAPVEAAPCAIERSSTYIPMRDGVLIAAELFLPRCQDDTRRPAILVQTRYYRAFEMSPVFRPFAGGPPEIIRRFVEHGYAWIETDVRGTGASTGSQRYPWAPDEVEDGREVVDWIVSQPWSSGAVGATGVSYDGTSAEMLARTAHPAVKAVAPRFSLFDVYTDIAFPGGVHNHWFTKSWSDGNRALDANEFSAYVGGLRGMMVRGVLPVSSDEDRTVLERALREHRRNTDIHQQALHIVCRDDVTPAGFVIDDMSPAQHAAELARRNVPVYGISGWFDGAYAHAAIKRFMSIPSLNGRLTIGPWNHGGRQNISPYADGGQVAFDQTGELIRFFDRYVRGIRNGIDDEPPIHYFTMGAERWREAASWPPATDQTTLYLSGGRSLSFDPPRQESAGDPYKVRLDVGSGEQSRWRSLFNIDGEPTDYRGREELCDKLLCYTSAPLPQAMELTGHPIVSLALSTTASDGQVFVYLEDVAPDGTSNYVTEGALRLIHRAIADDDDMTYRSPVPPRTFLRKDAAAVRPGEILELRFDLLPTSYRFSRGHRVRLLLAGHDRDLAVPVPRGPSEWTVYRDRLNRSFIELPVLVEGSGSTE